jgi:hypothetical protein
MNISLNVRWERPRWWYRVFTCKHEVGIFETIGDRYETKTSYMLCKKCGRTAMDIERSCVHEIDAFGFCRYCKERKTKFNCKHKDWCNEPDTDEFYCSDCGVWQDELSKTEMKL